ncbi:REST corepressor isoform X1 [Drosophila bipectinata]|uniref:REST corepressor isoform X1 n=1 Tax=Drosophila bipectinata TaxID=42026 RepID=UPI001C8B0582|nr:REST corepressor isoform X1 [Drosophila bipectinata]
MVLAERNTTDVVRNGRRSRGPSPNTHTTAVGGVANSTSLSSGGGGPGGGNSANAAAIDKAATAVPGAGTPESSDDDNSTKRNGKSKAKQSEYEEKIRVGRDYQAVCPPLVPEVERRPELMNERALLVWSPTKEIPDLKLEEYISVAKEKYGYNGEQALGMLFWHKHDLERAVMDLANFTPFPDEWTIEDKVLFEQAFQFHGKSFHRIRQMLPDKSIASLVKYYYSWKKTRHRSSAMDRQEKTIKAAVKDGSENGSEVGSNEESDNDDKKGLSYAVVSTAGSNNSTNSNAANNNSNINNNANNNNNNNNNSSNNNNNNNSNNNSSSSSNNNIIISNNSNTDMEPDQLCIFSTSTQGDEVLGFGLSSEGATTNGNANASGNSGGEVGGDPNSPRRVVVGGFCKTCNVVCHVLFDSPLGRMCKSCHTHWRRTGNRRPISGPESNTPRRSTHNSAAAADRSKRKPPKGMYINHDDLTALASCRNPSVYLAERDRKISALMAEIQKNRQLMEQLDKECDTINVDDVVSKPTAPNAETATAQPRISSRWSPDEIQVALLAFREYGKNYPMIAKLVATKTEAHVRTFYLNNRRRHNLDQIVKEYEAGKSEDSGAEEQAEPGVDGAAAVAMGAATAVPGAVDSTPAATKPSADASNNGGESTQEPLAKKEDKKKSELVTGTPKPSGGEEAAGTESPASALAGSSITVAASATDAAGLKSSTATITITDESDTATNSSSEVIASGSTGAAASSAITASATKQQAVASSDESSAPKSISTGGTTGAGSASSPPTNLNNKRESAPMNVADQPPAKKIGLSPAVEFAGK